MSDKWTEGPEVDGKAPGWERELIEKISLASVEESRRRRRWGIFFKLLGLIYFTALIYLLLPKDISDTVKLGEDHTALVEVEGVIAADTAANADDIVTGLRDAFEDKKTKGVILRINSPGGSPVQSGYVYDEIKRLREKYPKIPLYAVVSDICASGGYFIASAADKIYANKASIVGSIGVLMDGFGLVGTMDKLGIERRLMTAGEHKAIMDPFSPASEFDKKHIQTLLDSIHQQFIEAVKTGRGDRLKEDDSEVFSGLFWNGEEGLEKGLIDGLGSAGYVAREVIKAEKIVDFTAKEDVLGRLIERLGASASASFGQLLGLDGAKVMR